MRNNTESSERNVYFGPLDGYTMPPPTGDHCWMSITTYAQHDADTSRSVVYWWQEDRKAWVHQRHATDDMNAAARGEKGKVTQ